MIAEFFAGFDQVKFRKREIIIQAADEPAGIYFLESGYVRLYTTTSDGREITFNIFKPGSFFPMIWALGDVPNHYYFETLTPCVLRRAPRAKVQEYLNQNPAALADLTRRVLIGLDGLLANIEYLLSGSARQRVTATLLILARRKITLHLTHQEIATLTGLTRETVSTVMSALGKGLPWERELVS